MSGARPDTWMPLYWGDYLKDTGNLDAEKHGAYLLLIAHYWCSGEPLPDDDSQLAAISKVGSVARWRKIRPVISRFFFVQNGVWKHKRIEHELEQASGNIERRKAAGKLGGEAARGRSGRPKKIAMPFLENSNAISGEIAKELQKNTPSPSPSPIDLTIKGILGKTPSAGPNYADPEVRHQRHIQKLIEYAHRTLPAPEAETMMMAIMAGGAKAKEAIRVLSAGMKAEGNA